MIKNIHIKRFKSINDVQIDLGKVNVFIGENGSGKTNILEAIAFGSAAAANKLDNEFLVSRGIRVTEPSLMFSAFKKDKYDKLVFVFFNDGTKEYETFTLGCTTKDKYPVWFNLPYEIEKSENWKLIENLLLKQSMIDSSKLDKKIIEDLEPFAKQFKKLPTSERNKAFKVLRELIEKHYEESIIGKSKVSGFLIFSPLYKALRVFEEEGQIQPLGIGGEGLFKLLSTFKKEQMNELKENLKVLGWFEDFKIIVGALNERTLKIRDKYISPKIRYFDQRSANEGFLFLLFYFSLFISKNTPSFFAIDNIEASLNPKLCTELIKKLVGLSSKYDKQVLITTHSPAILDGLNLNDEMQRLFVVKRNTQGHTIVERIKKKKPLKGQKDVKLSEAFLRGYIGGLPKNF